MNCEACNNTVATYRVQIIGLLDQWLCTQCLKAEWRLIRAGGVKEIVQDARITVELAINCLSPSVDTIQ